MNFILVGYSSGWLKAFSNVRSGNFLFRCICIACSAANGCTQERQLLFSLQYHKSPVTKLKLSTTIDNGYVWDRFDRDTLCSL